MEVGMMSSQITQYHSAIVSLRKTIRENPSDAWAHSCLGAAYHKAGFPEAAVAQLHRAIALAPDFPLPYRQLAGVYRSLNDLQLAGIYHEKAEELVLKAKARAEKWRLEIAPSKAARKKPPLFAVGEIGPDQSN
jgi:Flp pilus assembly protein TadD